MPGGAIGLTALADDDLGNLLIGTPPCARKDELEKLLTPKFHFIGAPANGIP
jgi:hypothetical protein